MAFALSRVRVLKPVSGGEPPPTTHNLGHPFSEPFWRGFAPTRFGDRFPTSTIETKTAALLRGMSDDMERTLILLKPDAVQRRLCGELIGRLERKGLALVGMKLLHITPELAKKHYAEHVTKSFYPVWKRS